MQSNPSSIDRLLSRLRNGSAMRSDPSLQAQRSGVESVMDMTPMCRTGSPVGTAQHRQRTTGRMLLVLSTNSRSTPSLSDQDCSPAPAPAPTPAPAHPGTQGVSQFITADPPLLSSDEEDVQASMTDAPSTLSAVLEQPKSSGTFLQSVSMRSMCRSGGAAQQDLVPARLQDMGVQQLATVVRESIALGEQDMEAAHDMAQLFVVQREDLQPM